MMQADISFAFEELPLIVAQSIDVGLINGTATIGFDEDGDWHVVEVFLDAYQRIGTKSQCVPFLIDRSTYPWLFAAVVDRLQGERFEGMIREAVVEALEEQGIGFRTDREEHSTLNFVQQGV